MDEYKTQLFKLNTDKQRLITVTIGKLLLINGSQKNLVKMGRQLYGGHMIHFK